MRKLLMIVGIAALIPGALWANSIDVNPASALEGTGFGLQVDYTGAPSLAYVGSTHMQDETSVKIRFSIDPGTGALDGSAIFDMDPIGNVRFMNIFEDFTPGTGTKIVVFLKRSSADNAWRLATFVRENAGFFTFGGEGYLTGLTPPRNSTIVELEWRASDPGMSNGVIRATRTLVDPPSSTFTIFERTNLDNEGQTLNVLWAGSPSTTEEGNPEGFFRIDEFVITRQ